MESVEEQARESWDQVLEAVHQLNAGRVRRVLDTGQPVKALDAQGLVDTAGALKSASTGFYEAMLRLGVVGE